MSGGGNTEGEEGGDGTEGEKNTMDPHLHTQQITSHDTNLSVSVSVLNVLSMNVVHCRHLSTWRGEIGEGDRYREHRL